MAFNRWNTSIRLRVMLEYVAFTTLVFFFASVIVYYFDFWTAVAIDYLFILVAVIIFGFYRTSVINRDLLELKRNLIKYKNNLLAQNSDLDVSTKEINDLGDELKGFILQLQTCERKKRITDQAHAQYNDEMTTILSHFMYYISHVLRTPLNSIRWAVELLKNEEAGDITQAQRELLDQLENDSVKLAGVATELQDTLVVIRGKQIHAHPQVCHPLTIIDKVAGQWAVPAHRKNLQLVWDHPGEPMKTFTADCQLIQRALNFVVDNAVRYTPEGKTIAITITEINQAISPAQRKKMHIPPKLKKAGLVIAVVDQGIGIPKSELGHVFDPFFRASNAKDQWVDAKGLGLTLARAILHQHGGEIWLVSQKGKGTIAYLYIPKN
ncbi:HAMP domain-containing histidine kinase [Patescibacteria group bacterium]|nr:HAMP domain-containing histidine kinase [Patescibacteria group bacterium]MBU1705301.1 HAMP domain-containing histidine kinase [Patescibacteria group bacterium]